MCNFDTVYVLFVILFVSVNMVKTLGQYGCTPGTVVILFVMVFVSVKILSILGK